ncbi:RTA1 like protein-domain-containing protein [Podospora appendiculata]|uniref:RTA1 like protein-domain-containing protein n=1 Tax=Podospora appendiculata TaxID=314037 RepID=A0AAE0XH10_9PEZI|nr:RTA1 like protein-domain-containing protein [Podospora appendiculata]
MPSSSASSGPPAPHHDYYKYAPSLAGNVIYIVLFSIVSIGHVFFMIRSRTWYFIPFVLGCLFEAIGFVGRAIGANETPNWTLGPFIMQTLLILLGPTLYAASIYMVLARLIRLLDAHQYSLVRTSWLTTIFVSGDVLSFITQGAGGGILSNADTQSRRDLGNNIILAGLGIQVVFFGLFIITTVMFHIRITRKPTQRTYSVTTPWQQFIMALYAASILIMVRSIFRMIEFSAGRNGTLQNNEVYLLVLDSALMLLVAIVFLWYHPSRILIGYKDVGSGGPDVENRTSGNSGTYPMVTPNSTLPKPYDSDATSAVQGQPQYTYDATPGYSSHSSPSRR